MKNINELSTNSKKPNLPTKALPMLGMHTNLGS